VHPRLNPSNNSSLVIDRLCDQVEAGDMAVACVYCDFHASNKQSTTGLLGALLKQVVSALEPIPDEVRKAFENSKGVLAVAGSCFLISLRCSSTLCHSYVGYSFA